MTTLLPSIAAFTVAATLITITPGLDTTLVLRTAAVEGQRKAAVVAAGINIGLFTWAVAVALGIGALLALSHLAFRCLELAGAAYLIWLGQGMLRHPRSTLEAAEAIRTIRTIRKRRANAPLARGILSNLLNPKVAVFYVTFLPQFVPHGIAAAPFLILLGAIHVAINGAWFAVMILATRPLARALQRANIIRALDRLCGGVLLGFGVRLAL